MIEIEKSYIINNKQALANIVSCFDFLKEGELKDIYFDKKDYTLMKQRKFLRIRNNEVLELKMVKKDHGERVSQEIVYKLSDANIENKKNLQNIISNLNINNLQEVKADMDIENWLVKNKFVPFIKINTIRKSYIKQGVKIDIDHIHPGLILVDVERSGQGNLYEKTIREFENNNNFVEFKGKFVICLERTNKEAFKLFKKINNY